MDEAALFGVDLFGEPIRQRTAGPLAERFQFSPFSVLDARAGEWQERKQAWMSLGIEGEVNPLGRDENLTHNTNSWFEEKGKTGGSNTTSIFDPVLAEMCYRWFSPEGAQIVDPFAGGSVRGIVSALTGRKYWGCDLRPEQIAANEEQRAKICPDGAIQWITGDAMEALAYAPDADFIFACPPYGDLEQYSDDPLDLSTMDYYAFIPALGRIILRCAERLKNHRAACFVVGDFRDKKTGLLRGFPGDVVTLFRQAGMCLYNEAVLVTPCGSLPIRVGKQFDSSKKLGKTHQNVLVFVKGDPKKAFARAS